MSRQFNSEKAPTCQTVDLTLGPLSSTGARKFALQGFCSGSRIACSSSKPEQIYEDIKTVSPTLLLGPPLIFNIVWNEFKETLHNLCTQKYGTKSLSESERMDITEIAYKQVRPLLGERIEYISTGGAMTDPLLIHFLRECFHVIVTHGYGATEGDQNI